MKYLLFLKVPHTLSLAIIIDVNYKHASQLLHFFVCFWYKCRQAKALVVFFRRQRFPVAPGFQEAGRRIHVSNSSLPWHPHPSPYELTILSNQGGLFSCWSKVRNKEQADLADHPIITLPLTNTPGLLTGPISL